MSCSQDPAVYPNPEPHSAQEPTQSFMVITFFIIPSSMLRLSKSSLSIRFPYQFPVCISHQLHACHMPRPSHSSGFDHTNNYKVFSSRRFCLCSLFNFSLTSFFLWPKYLSVHFDKQMHLQMCSSYGSYSLTNVGFIPFFLSGI